MSLNLVQVQERLKSVPMQALMQYANGSNPDVPPFLALGELNRRRQMQEAESSRIATENAGAPSIKQQIEQTAGLMALQGSRQQQAAQQQQATSAMTPMAAPNTVTSEPAQMAEGGFIRDYEEGGEVEYDISELEELLSGIAQLPTGNIFTGADYAGGGVVAFAGPEGSYVDPVGLAPWELETEEERKNRERGGILGALRRAIAIGDPDIYEVERPKKVPSLSDAQQSMVEDRRERDLQDILSRASKPKEEPVSERVAAPKGPSAPKKEEAGPEVEREFLRNLYKAPVIDYEAELKKRDLAERPDTGRELAELRRQLGEYSKSSDSFVNRLLALEPGRKGIGSGSIGRSVGKYEAERTARINQLQAGIAKAEDLNAKADYEFRRGNFDAAIKLKTEAEKENAINANRAGSIGVSMEQIEAQERSIARDPVEIRLYNLWASQQPQGADRSYSAYLRAKTMGDERLAFDKKKAVDSQLEKDMNYRILSISDKPEDRRKAEAIKARAYAEAGLGGVSGGGGNRIRLDAQGNIIQ